MDTYEGVASKRARGKGVCVDVAKGRGDGVSAAPLMFEATSSRWAQAARSEEALLA